METAPLTARRLDEVSTTLAAYAREVLVLPAAKVPVSAARDAILTGLGVAGPLAPDEGVPPSPWDPDVAFEAFRATVEPGNPYSLAACVSAIGPLLRDHPAPPREVSAAILASPFGRESLLHLWVDDVPAACAHPAFARLCATVVEAAAAAPDIFVEANVEDLSRRPGTSRQRKAALADGPRVLAELADLAGRPLHPAWPALVLAGIHAYAAGRVEGKDDDGALSTDEFDMLADAFADRDDPELAPTLPHSFLDALQGLPNGIVARMADGIGSGIGRTLRALGPGGPRLSAMADMGAPCVGLDGEPGDLDLDFLPWGYLGDPDRRRWAPLVDPDDDDAPPIPGIWRRVVARREDLGGDLDTLTAGQAMDVSGLVPGLDESEVVHVVGTGPRSFAVIPLLAIRVATEVSSEGREVVIRSRVLSFARRGPVTAATAVKAFAWSLEIAAIHDISARKRVIAQARTGHDVITVAYDASAVEPELPGLSRLLDAMAARNQVKKRSINDLLLDPSLY